MADEQLLERYLQQHDQAAFAELVRIHAPMVWGVCRRVLGHHHDAEEAFQATFVVLARKGSAIGRKMLLANWLFGVAHRAAQNARRTRAIRRIRERPMTLVPEAASQSDAPLAEAAWPEIAPFVDRELSRLPEKYRAAIILCDLEGCTQKEAASRLGCPEGTLSSCLTRARELLRQRLARSGVVVSIGALALALSRQAASASVPDALMQSTLQLIPALSTATAVGAGIVSPSVTALCEGVMKAMLYAQLKRLALLTSLAIFVGLGAGGALYQNVAAEPQAADGNDSKSENPKAAGDTKASAEAKEVMKKLEGTWKIVSLEVQGKVHRNDDPNAPREALMKFSGSKVVVSEKLMGIDRGTAEGTLKIDVTKQPFEIDMMDFKEVNTKQKAGQDHRGIFEFNGDVLRIRSIEHTDGKDLMGQPVSRPSHLGQTNASDHPHEVLWTLERVGQ